MLVGTKAQPGGWGEVGVLWESVVLWIILMPRQTQFRSLNIVGELQMPAEVLFGDEDGRVPEHGADGKTPKNWVWYFGWEQPVVR
jgi:hypothetical protein